MKKIFWWFLALIVSALILCLMVNIHYSMVDAYMKCAETRLSTMYKIGEWLIIYPCNAGI